MSVRNTFHWPAEHGAWGVLLVPYVCAAGVAGRWNLPVALCGVCVLALFVLRGSLQSGALARPSAGPLASMLRRLAEPVHLLLAASALAAAALLVFYFGRRELVALGLTAAMLYGLQMWLITDHRERSSEKRSLAAELIGVVLLTLSAPAAWISACGSLVEATHKGILNAPGVQVWLLNLLFFLGGILYVKFRVRGLLAHREFPGVRERFAFAWPVFVYHLLVVVFLIAWVIVMPSGKGRAPATAGPRGWLIGLAFTPAILRAGGLAFDLGRRFPIRRLGWTEMLHAALFAALLVFAFRVGG